MVALNVCTWYYLVLKNLLNSSFRIPFKVLNSILEGFSAFSPTALLAHYPCARNALRYRRRALVDNQCSTEKFTTPERANLGIIVEDSIVLHKTAMIPSQIHFQDQGKRMLADRDVPRLLHGEQEHGGTGYHSGNILRAQIRITVYLWGERWQIPNVTWTPTEVFGAVSTR